MLGRHCRGPGTKTNKKRRDREGPRIEDDVGICYLEFAMDDPGGIDLAIGACYTV